MFKISRIDAPGNAFHRRAVSMIMRRDGGEARLAAAKAKRERKAAKRAAQAAKGSR